MLIFSCGFPGKKKIEWVLTLPLCTLMGLESESGANAI